MISEQKGHSSRVLRMTVWLIWVLFVAAYLATKFSIYYTLPWFDTGMHFFGGFVTAFVVYVILLRSKLFKAHSILGYIAVLVSISFGVGFFWEIFEYVVNIIIPTYTFDPIDTTVDLIADTVGATCAAALLFIRGKKYHHGK